MTDDTDDLLTHHERRKEDWKDAQKQVDREIESRKGWNKIDSLNSRITNASREEYYERLEEEVAARAAQMRESKASLLEEMSKYHWVKAKWRDALTAIILTRPDAETELDALLAEIHQSKESSIITSFTEWSDTMLQGPNERKKTEIGWIETSLRSLKSKCNSYQRALR
jgi:hypothetical protein